MGRRERFQDTKVEFGNHVLLTDNLLSALEDGTKVAIVVGREDLDLLILLVQDGLKHQRRPEHVSERMKSLADGLTTLRDRVFFGGP